VIAEPPARRCLPAIAPGSARRGGGHQPDGDWHLGTTICGAQPLPMAVAAPTPPSASRATAFTAGEGGRSRARTAACCTSPRGGSRRRAPSGPMHERQSVRRNPLKRYAIGDHDPLTCSDGSLTLDPACFQRRGVLPAALGDDPAPLLGEKRGARLHLAMPLVRGVPLMPRPKRCGTRRRLPCSCPICAQSRLRARSP
jgi:hypothetical protein